MKTMSIRPGFLASALQALTRAMSLRQLLLALAATLLLGSAPLSSAIAAEGGVPLDPFPAKKLTDKSALQDGARTFVNYCQTCHGVALMRYNRLQDIGLSDAQIRDGLIFDPATKVGDTMRTAIRPEDAKVWFGAMPPDLSVITRARSSGAGSGSDLLYTYLRSFYRDTTRATGWNNSVFPNVGMPHALWELQGERKPVYAEQEEHGHKVAIFKGWEQVTPGTMTPLQYEQAVGDLVGYMQWMGEPAQNTRVRIGVWVLLFLLVLSFVTWRLNAAYWKDVK